MRMPEPYQACQIHIRAKGKEWNGRITPEVVGQNR